MLVRYESNTCISVLEITCNTITNARSLPCSAFFAPVKLMPKPGPLNAGFRFFFLLPDSLKRSKQYAKPYKLKGKCAIGTQTRDMRRLIPIFTVAILAQGTHSGRCGHAGLLKDQGVRFPAPRVFFLSFFCLSFFLSVLSCASETECSGEAIYYCIQRTCPSG